MAKKTSRSALQGNGVTLAAKQKSNRFNLKIVLLELKALYPILNADMDDETREATERTLINCRDKLEVIARFFHTRPVKPEPAPAHNAEAAHG